MNREDGGRPGRWLRERREDAGLSQEELANRSGLSVRTVSSLERGSIRTPHPRTIRLLGETLGLPAEACDELIAAYRAGSRGRPVATSAEPALLTGPAGFAVPRELPGLARRFVGREDELAVLSALADQAPGNDEDTAVRAVFSWSYRHLDAGTARAFRLAGLYPGPVLDKYAAAALLGTTAARAGHLLDVLARGYLIQPTRAGRYAMHDLLRGYARELAGRHDGEQERHRALTRLFGYYLHSAATAMAVLRPAERTALDAVRLAEAPAAIVPGPFGGPAAALTWLDAERACLLAAVEYMAENGWPGQASRMAYVLLWYLDGRGHYPEALIVHGHGRRAARKIADRAAEARALLGLGVVALRQGRYPQAADHLQQAVDLARQAGNLDGMADMLSELGAVALRQGQLRRAASLSRRACGVFRKTGNRTGEAHALNGLGEALLAAGRPGDARAEFAAALGLASRIGLRNQQARAHRGLGRAWDALGDPGQARRHWQEALAIFTDLGIPVDYVPERRPALVDALVRASQTWGVSLACNKGLAGAPANALQWTADTSMNPAVLDSFALAITSASEPSAYPGIPGHEPDVALGRQEAKIAAAAMAPLKALAPQPASYVNETDYFEDDWQTAFWGGNYARLTRVKARYDPGGLFPVHHGVGTET